MAKPCLQPRCPNLAKGRASFCEDHAARAWEGKARRRGHSGWELSALKARVKREDGPWCAICRVREGVELDHVVPLSQGGAPLDRSNVRLLCPPCHRRKSQEEAASGG